MRTEFEPGEAQLFVEFATETVGDRLALVEPATGQCPDRRARELEPDQQDVVVGVEQDRPGGLPESQCHLSRSVSPAGRR